MIGASSKACHGYDQGLASIRYSLKQTLAGGVRDINYWRDSIRWLGRTCNIVNDKKFCLAAIQIMHQVYGLFHDSIRSEIIRAVCSLEIIELNAELMDKALWLLLEAESRGEPILSLGGSIVDKLLSIGRPACLKAEFVPSLIRLLGRESSSRTLFAQLAEFVLKHADDAPGKVLWTLADNLPTMIEFESEPDTWQVIASLLGPAILETSSLKAKVHIARTIRAIILHPELPDRIRERLLVNARLCAEWLDRCEQPPDLEECLFQRYKHNLKLELESLSQNRCH